MICGVIRPRLRPLWCGVLVAVGLVGGVACSASRVPPPDRSVFVGSSASPAVPTASGTASQAVATPTAAATPQAVPGATRVGTRAPVVDHGPRTGAKVALTFDADMTDGMLASLRAGRVKSYANLRILDLLERERVPATFFLTGKWVQRYPDVTRADRRQPALRVGQPHLRARGVHRQLL